MYADQVEAFQRAFQRVRVYLFDDLVSDPLALVRDLYGFIGADTDFVPEIRVENPGVSIRHPGFNRFLRNESVLKDLAKRLLTGVGLSPEQIRRMKKSAMASNTGEKERLDEASRSELTKVFSADVLRLQDLIDRDLSAWCR
jgi:hypothetical protein